MERSVRLLTGLALSVLSAAVNGGDAATLAEFSRSGDLICDMRVSGLPQRGARPRSDLMLIIDEVGARAGAARVVSSRSVGGRNVRIYVGETGVHLVEDIGQSVMVTTLLDCDVRAGNGRCVRYNAVMAWHFDRGVHLDADASFRKWPGTSYVGSCEAWKMEGVRSADNR